MSDESDQMMQHLMSHLTATYGSLGDVVHLLPVPIHIPTEGMHQVTDLIVTVERVIDLAEEEPMPEEQQAALIAAALHWLAAADLIAIAVSRSAVSGSKRLLTAALLLSEADDALGDLMVWLVASA
jgi:hypothetical protein